MDPEESRIVSEGNALRRRELDLAEERHIASLVIAECLVGGFVLIVATSAVVHGLAQLNIDWSRGFFWTSVASAIVFFVAMMVGAQECNARYRTPLTIMLFSIFVAAISW